LPRPIGGKGDERVHLAVEALDALQARLDHLDGRASARAELCAQLGNR
jgi:hypothetical protein